MREKFDFFTLINSSEAPVTVIGERQSIDDTGGYGVRTVAADLQPGASQKIPCEFRIHGQLITETTMLNVYPLGQQSFDDPLVYEVHGGEQWEIVVGQGKPIMKEKTISPR